MKLSVRYVSFFCTRWWILMIEDFDKNEFVAIRCECLQQNLTSLILQLNRVTQLWCKFAIIINRWKIETHFIKLFKRDEQIPQVCFLLIHYQFVHSIFTFIFYHIQNVIFQHFSLPSSEYFLRCGHPQIIQTLQVSDPKSYCTFSSISLDWTHPPTHLNLFSKTATTIVRQA